MEKDPKAQRKADIECAAMEVLAEVGFKKASMLQIAKRAKASNETLYAWYGNKQKLFSAIIEENAKVLKTTLDSVPDGPDASVDTLLTIARLLLHFTVTEKAIIVNRAAVADAADTGLLAEAIEQHARKPILDRLVRLMQPLPTDQGAESLEAARRAADTFVGLLFGELQMQQALGRLDPLNEAQIDARAAQAVSAFTRLYPSWKET